jgi:hypothetical protein
MVVCLEVYFKVRTRRKKTTQIDYVETSRSLSKRDHAGRKMGDVLEDASFMPFSQSQSRCDLKTTSTMPIRRRTRTLPRVEEKIRPWNGRQTKQGFKCCWKNGKTDSRNLGA